MPLGPAPPSRRVVTTVSWQRSVRQYASLRSATRRLALSGDPARVLRRRPAPANSEPLNSPLRAWRLTPWPCSGGELRPDPRQAQRHWQASGGGVRQGLRPDAGRSGEVLQGRVHRSTWPLRLHVAEHQRAGLREEVLAAGIERRARCRGAGSQSTTAVGVSWQLGMDRRLHRLAPSTAFTAHEGDEAFCQRQAPFHPVTSLRAPEKRYTHSGPIHVLWSTGLSRRITARARSLFGTLARGSGRLLRDRREVGLGHFVLTCGRLIALVGMRPAGRRTAVTANRGYRHRALQNPLLPATDPLQRPAHSRPLTRQTISAPLAHGTMHQASSPGNDLCPSSRWYPSEMCDGPETIVRLGSPVGLSWLRTEACSG